MIDTGIIIKGIPPYDGEYELDLDQALSTREWRWIKSISGYLPLTLTEGLEGGDPSVICALAVIALVRNRKVAREDALDVSEKIIDAPFEDTRIQFVSSAEEDDDLPPVLTSEPDASSPKSSLTNGEPRRLTSETSGDSSSIGSETSDEIQWPTTALR